MPKKDVVPLHCQSMTMRASAALAEKLQTGLHFARLHEPCSVERQKTKDNRQQTTMIVILSIAKQPLGRRPKGKAISQSALAKF